MIKMQKLGSTYIAKPEGKHALNVAISRAVEKMIVFKSIYSKEVSATVTNDSIRVFKEWLLYLESTSKKRQTYSIQSSKKSETFESEFEEDVYDEIVNSLFINKKIYIETQFPIGSYKVDIVLLDYKTNKFI